MKLTLIGAGVRSPLFAAVALRRAERLGLDELYLLDTDGDRLALFTTLIRQQAREAGSLVRISSGTAAGAALEGARHVVITIRVGGEQGRVIDERTALAHGVLGQETTGPGGFAMALRNVPVVLGYAELLERLSPGAWLYSFTNPAGLVTQALRDAGFARAIGICDSANAAQHAVARFLDLDVRDLQADVYGLNHLSWTSRVRHGGRDLLSGLLADASFRSGTSLSLFEPGLIDLLGVWPNEYLYYFYDADRAVAEICRRDVTRGEQVRDATASLLAELRAMRPDDDPGAALARFHAYHRTRSATYLAGARHVATQGEEPAAWGADDEESYAAVMLDVVEALETGGPMFTALNVPNRGAIGGMADDDVVEVSCTVDEHGVRPLPIGTVPPAQLALMRAVKTYERLTVAAIQSRSRQLAVQALMCHPLVLTYPRARALVDDYLAAHQRYLGW